MGVSQGSVLGPEFCCLHRRSFTVCQTAKREYADDTVLYVTIAHEGDHQMKWEGFIGLKRRENE